MFSLKGFRLGWMLNCVSFLHRSLHGSLRLVLKNVAIVGVTEKKPNGDKIIFISNGKLRSNIEVPMECNLNDETYDSTRRKDVNKSKKCTLSRISYNCKLVCCD